MKTVMITGASRGLGLAIAERLVADGCRVIAVARTEPEQLGELVRARPEQVVFRRLDLADLDSIPAFVAACERQVGPLFGLVNNAAVGLDGLLATQHAADIDRILRVNLHAPILLTKHACRGMLVRRAGRIVTISSIVAATGFSGLAVYAASKAGLEGFTRALAREVGRVGVTANCVAPGFLETDMTAGLAADRLETVRRRSPLGLARPGDVAAAVAYLVSDAAARITGTVLTVDGGSRA